MCEDNKVFSIHKCKYIRKKKTTHNTDRIPIGRSRGPKFKGIVIDSGAERSCVGWLQAVAYCTSIRQSLPLRRSNNAFRFADEVLRSKGIIEVIIKTSHGSSLTFECDVVNSDVPMLLGLDIMRREGMVIDISKMVLRNHEWSLPMGYAYGHLVVQLISSTLYSRKQLIKLHRHYRHPTADKLYAILKRVNPNKVNTETLQILKDIQMKCSPCAKFSRKPLSFQIGNIDTNEIVFNKEIAMDIFWIEGTPVLHVIDLGTRYSAAQLLTKKPIDTDEVWNAFLKCWVLVYAGMPEIMFCDQGKEFTSKLWNELAEENGVIMKYAGV